MGTMFYDDDIDEFFDIEEFATTAFVDPTGLRNSISVIWDNEYYEQDGGSYGADTSSRSPAITCKTTDAEAFLAQGVIVEIDCVNYSVKDIESDGTGVSTVPLFKV